MTILFTYLLVLLLAYLLQRNLMYFPEKHTKLQQQQVISRLQLTLWPSAKDYRGLINNNQQLSVNGTVLVFHGNAGSAAGRVYYMEALEKLGYRVILAEYPGYGQRTGKPTQAALVSDGVETAKLALQQFGEPLYLWGESLGGGIVSGIVHTQHVPVAGIIMLMPFDSMSRVAQRHYWYLLGGLLTLDKYDNIQNLRGYSGNIAVILSEEDNVIPNAHSLKLYDSLKHQKKLWSFANAGHNNWPVAANLPWWGEVMTFVSNEHSGKQ